MDHQAFAQLLGNYGEFVGAIAVVATLAYLTIQVRQNTQVIRFRSGRESARLSVDIALALLQPAVSDALSTANAGEELNDSQLNVLDQLVYAWMTSLHQDFLEYEAGLQDDDWWEVKKSTISMILSFPAHQRIWEGISRQYWTSEFCDMVDKILSESGADNYFDRIR